jgi:phenylacetate-CoA ligase
MTDAAMPTCNCTAQTETFHLPEDAFLVEVIDPETGEDLAGTGRVGEIAVSPLLWEGTPLFRFMSGDVGYTLTDPCPCGRTGARLGVTERTAHALRVGERLVYSAEVEEIIYGHDELFLKHYHLVKQRVQPQPRLLIRLEQPDDDTTAKRIQQDIEAEVNKALGVEAVIEYMAEDDERFVAAYKFLRVVEE